MRVSVIIPALNEEVTIADVVRGVPLVTANEVIVVDNGSEDSTSARASEAGAHVITEYRHGYGRACAAGVRALSSDCEIVVFLDGDGSDCPELMDRLVDPIKEGRYDFVIGSRTRGHREPGSLNLQQVFAGRAAGLFLRALYGVRYTDMCPFRTFLYGYEPNEIIQEAACTSGNNMLFLLGADGNISYRMPTYYGARLLTKEWAEPGNGNHELYLATANEPALHDQSLVTAYAVLRPDGWWAVMALNKDSCSEHTVAVTFHNGATGSESGFEGAVDLYQYSRKQYELSAEKEEPYPIRDQQPEHRTLRGSGALPVQLPPYSITVMRGIGPVASQSTDCPR